MWIVDTIIVELGCLSYQTYFINLAAILKQYKRIHFPCVVEASSKEFWFSNFMRIIKELYSDIIIVL